MKLKFLNFKEKLALVRGIQALQGEASRSDLDEITMQAWLEQNCQPQRVIDRFWRQVLVSAINEELHQMAASHGFQVFRLGFLQQKNSYEMGVPAVPLGDLYNASAWNRFANVEFRYRTAASRIVLENGSVRAVLASGEEIQGDYFVSALPFEKLASVIPELRIDLSAFEHSPITGIHLWFDRPITDLPHATLLDRTIQWMFNKKDGRYIQLVVSASRSLTEMPRAAVIGLALRELAEFFPSVKDAKLEKAHVVKEVRATFSAKPGLEIFRPGNKTRIPNLFLAGDWTKSGWPATMEGAVRSGYLAAEAVTAAAGMPAKFIRPDA